MLRQSRFTILFTLISFHCLLCTYGADNLIKNPSFEKILPDKIMEHGKASKVPFWHVFFYPTHHYKAGISTENPHTGNNAAFLEVPAEKAPEKTLFWQSSPISITAGKKYDLSMWLRTIDFKAKANWYKIRVFAIYQNNKQQRIKHEDLIVIGNEQKEWQQFSKTFTVKNIKGATQMVLCLGMSYCTGTVFFDDITLKLSEEKTESTLIPKDHLPVFPQPKQVKTVGPSFSITDLNPDWSTIPGGPQKQYLQKSFNEQLSAKSIKTNANGIKLNFQFDTELSTDKQWYKLQINPEQITVSAPSLTGIGYGLQTFYQLLCSKKQMPNVIIKDWPDFKTRGIITGSFSVKTMDLLVPYKINLYWPCRGDYPCREWTRPMTHAEKEQLSSVIKGGEERMITVMFGLRPGYGETELHFSNPEHLNAILNKYKTFYELGLRHFTLAFDDLFNIGRDQLSFEDDKSQFKNIGNAHYWLTLQVYNYLKTLDKANQLYIIPMFYYDPTQYSISEKDYLKSLGKLPSDIQFINCGTLTKQSITNLEQLIKRKPFFWSNFMSQYEGMKQVPEILTPVEFDYSHSISTLLKGFAFVAWPKHIMMKQLFSDFMWNADNFNPNQSFELSLRTLKGADAVILKAYTAFMNSIKHYPFAGVHKEEMLKLTKHTISGINSWKQRLSKLPPNQQKKYSEEIDEKMTVYKTLLNELKNKPHPLKIYRTSSGFSGLKTTISNFVKPYKFWNSSTPEFPTADTTVSIGYDSNFLYIKYICNEPMTSKLRATQTKRDGMVFTDDCVELFIQPPSSSYYHLSMNSIGTLYDAMEFDKSWDASAEVSTEKRKQSWLLKCKIPWSSFSKKPTKGAIWKMNFCRSRFTVGKEFSSAFLLIKGFHEKERFWQVQFQ